MHRRIPVEATITSNLYHQIGGLLIQSLFSYDFLESIVGDLQVGASTDEVILSIHMRNPLILIIWHWNSKESPSQELHESECYSFILIKFG